MKTSNDLKKRIRQSKRDYGPNEQRAELLKRNPTFLQNLEGIKNRLGNRFFELYSSDTNLSELKTPSKDNVLLKEDWPKVTVIETGEDPDTIYNRHITTAGFYGDRCDDDCWVCGIKRDPYFKGQDDLNTILVDKESKSWTVRLDAKWIVLDRFIAKWWKFCNKWNIDGRWEGELPTLSKFMNPVVTIDSNSKNPYLPICINIGPRTRPKDITDRWSDVERIQKTLRSEVPAKSQNFWRDSWWYDLNKKYGQRPGDIAKFWAEQFPDDVDLLAMKTIKRYEKNDLSEEDTLELLNEIKTDPAMAQLREQFEDQRRLYTEWPNYRLRDLIKKTIKNMQKRVETVEKASLFKPAFSRHREK